MRFTLAFEKKKKERKKETDKVVGSVTLTGIFFSRDSLSLAQCSRVVQRAAFLKTLSYFVAVTRSQIF